MPAQTELSHPSKARRKAPMIFYAAAAVCGAAGSLAGPTAPHGRGYIHVAVIALAALSAWLLSGRWYAFFVPPTSCRGESTTKR